MNTLFILLPIFLIVAVLSVIGLFMAKLRIWKPKRTFYFLIVYAICGLAAFMYISFASSDMNKAVSKETIRQQQIENERMMERLKLRDYTVLKEQQLQFTKTFEPTAEDVTVNRDGQLRGIYTVINWVDTADNVITASYYETPIYTRYIQITPYINSPTITFENNTIFIKDKESKYTMKTLNMSLEMIDGERGINITDGFIGNRILYLNVPKQFNIIDSGGWY